MPTNVFSHEGRLEELLRHASDVVVELEPDGRLLFVSGAVERALGRTADSLVGLSFLEVILPEDHESALSVFQKVVSTGHASMINLRVARTDGLRVELETTLRAFLGDSDQQRIVAVCRDVTERASRVAVDRQRDAHHRALAQSGTRPAAIATSDGTIQFSNRRFREVFGNEPSLQALRAGVSHESRRAMDLAWHQATSRRAPSVGTLDFEFVPGDGEPSWFSASWETISSDGAERRFALFCEDITQRKKIEGALRTIARGISDSEPHTLRPIVATLAGALEMDRLILGLLDEAQGTLRPLAAWQDGESFDLDGFDLQGLPDAAVARGDACLHPAGVCELMPSVAESIGPDFESYAGFPLRHIDGTVFGIIGGYGRKPIGDPDLVRALLSSFATQVAAVIERRPVDTGTLLVQTRNSSPRAAPLTPELTKRRSGELGRDLLYRVVQSGADLVFVCESDTTLRFANEAATRLVKWPSPDETIDKTFIELLNPEEAARLRTEILPKLTPTRPWSGELALLTPDKDEPTPTEATLFLFQGTEETPGPYLAITLRDIGQRRSAEEALHQSESRLRQAEKMEAVGRMTGGIAHDFNNLLTAILGYSDLVLDELGEAHEARSDTEEIRRAAQRAGGLTRQLLAFSRRQALQSERIDLNAVVADTDRMLRRLIGENIELVTLQNGELHPIFADAGQIEQVIVNLVVNARDAMPRGGRIEIETMNFTVHQTVETTSGALGSGNYVVLRVSDDGVGMESAILDQIFDPFFTTKEADQGTGLGLASAYGIVDQNGGQIDVESVPEQGTTFSIYLPALREESDENRSTAHARPSGGNETILVVEDSASLRRLVQKTLEKSGYRVLAAESATAALRHCSRHVGEIDLLLMDVVLPRATGPEVARRAVELRPGIRVLFMSGFTDDTLTRHGLRPGTTDLLEKPFTPATVLTRIRNLLDAPVASLENTLSPDVS